MVKYDAICTGAGPAGSSAGRAMAMKGLKVLMLDRHVFPRDKTCGGGLRPDVFKRFPHVKARSDEFLDCECKRVVAYSRNPELYFEYSERPLIKYDMRREVFDNVMMEMALDEGARLEAGMLVKGARVKDDEVVVACKGRDGTVEFRSDLVLASAGALDPVGRMVRVREGLPPSWTPDEMAVAISHEYHVGEAYLDDVYGKERTSIFHLGYGGMFGYAWAFGKREHINVGFGTFVSVIKQGNLLDVNRQYIGSLKKNGLFPKDMDIVKPNGAMIPMKGGLKRTVTDRVMLIGDSAGFVSPVTGDGIFYALDSGEIAAGVALQASEKGDFSQKTLGAYHKAWRKAWGKDLDVMVDLSGRIDAVMDDLFRYVQDDREFREMVVDLYMGHVEASKLDMKIKMRFARNKMRDKLGLSK